MTHDTTNRPARSVTAVAAAALVLALGACTSNIGANDYTPHDINANHPIEVARESVSIVVAVPTGGTLAPASPDDARRLKTFIRDYVQRGRTAITVETQMADNTRRFLEAQGLRSHEIQIVSDTTLKAPNAALSFTANVAKVPECGDFSRPSTFDPNNRPHSNFGCSMRRNMGLSVADPGDLIDSQPAGGHPAAPRDSAVDTYRAGPAPDTGGTAGDQ